MFIAKLCGALKTIAAGNQTFNRAKTGNAVNPAFLT
jgi:hypothetical protein